MKKNANPRHPSGAGKQQAKHAKPAVAAAVAASAATTRPARTEPQTWRFEALDTWFFRESRPHESVGGAQLASQFPPSARTLIGAIRTTVGDSQQVNWAAYQQDDTHPLRACIGTPEALAPLRFQGPYLMKDKLRLYPAPLVLMHAGEGAQTVFTRLEPSAEPVWCDLGRVRLPRKRQKEQEDPKRREALLGAQPLEGAWLTSTGLVNVLQGGLPSPDQVWHSAALFHTEPRLGIALEQHTRRPLDGLLYQTRHVRPASGVSVGISVRGLDLAKLAHELPKQGLARLGGEGRLAAWTRQAEPVLSRALIPPKARRLMVVLLSPARFAQGWLPDGFVAEDSPTQGRFWRGELAGRPARLVCAVTGKPQRQGGWNMAHHQPRDLRGLVPAGSCYFFEFDTPADAQHVATHCHGQALGQDTDWGYGQVVVGVWL